MERARRREARNDEIGGWLARARTARGRRSDGARTARRGCEGGNIVYKNTGNALIDAESIASHEDVARAL